MTEEEKKAIRRFYWINHLNKKFGIEVALISSDSKHIETLLNLIEKLRKENEELKNKVAKRNNELIELEETSEKEFLTKQEVKENYIPKGKIREKLEKIEKEKEQYYAAGQHLMYMLLKNQLKSLIEEE